MTGRVLKDIGIYCATNFFIFCCVNVNLVSTAAKQSTDLFVIAYDLVFPDSDACWLATHHQQPQRLSLLDEYLCIILDTSKVT